MQPPCAGAVASRMPSAHSLEVEALATSRDLGMIFLKSKLEGLVGLRFAQTFYKVKHAKIHY